MTFRRKIEDGIGLVVAQQPAYQFRIAHIAMHKNVGRIVMQCGKIFQIARVGQLVKIDDALPALASLQNIAGADEAGASGDQNGFVHTVSLLACGASQVYSSCRVSVRAVVQWGRRRFRAVSIRSTARRELRGRGAGAP